MSADAPSAQLAADSRLQIEASTSSDAPQEKPSAVTQFLRKARGVSSAVRPGPRKLNEAVFDALFAAVGIGALAALNKASLRHRDLVQLVASFAATAVLVYAAPLSPLAQPRNVVGGNMVSSICGVAMSKAFHSRPDLTWLAAGLSVGLAVFFMGLFGVTHPPAGATALIAVIGDEAVKHAGWLYIIQPVLTASLFMVITAMLFNNALHKRSYPQYW
jgi:CBS domain-containing membrane protein